MPDGPLEQLLAREEVVARKLGFARAADARDPDAMVACFAEDAVAVYDPAEPLRGRETIRSWYASVLGPVAASSHMLTNLEVRLTAPGEAELRCYLYSWQRFEPGEGRPDRQRWARYVDTWRRGPGGWELTSLRLLQAGETPAVADDRVGEYRRENY